MRPSEIGGSSDVWKADNPDSADGTVFALKVLHITMQDNFTERKKVQVPLHAPGLPMFDLTFRDSVRKRWLPNKSNTTMSWQLKESK